MQPTQLQIIETLTPVLATLHYVPNGENTFGFSPDLPNYDDDLATASVVVNEDGTVTVDGASALSLIMAASVATLSGVLAAFMQAAGMELE